MRGVWNDEHVRCSARRRLAVTMLVDHGGRRVSRSGRFLDGNRSEGGPNVGFTLSARPPKRCLEARPLQLRHDDRRADAQAARHREPAPEQQQALVKA
jgi:hypothetical protein